jgi:Ca2+-binding RTX toxin-like protein
VTATDPAGAAVSDEFSLAVAADSAGEHFVGTKNKDVLVGSGCDDLIEGLQGNDRLYGLGGDDVLAGGRGNDRLEGGLGADVYLHGLHDGHDTIREAGPDRDALALGEGIRADMVRLRRHHDDLVVDIHGRGASVAIAGWFKSARRRVESVVFADGTTWDEGEILERTRRIDHGTDRCDPPRGDHHGDRDDHHGHWRTDAHGKSGGDHGPRDERDGMRHRLSHAPRFDFEALVAAFDRSGRDPSPSSVEIERRWTAVTRYASSLHDDGDDSRRGAPAFNRVLRSMPGLAAAHGWGFDGSTGASRDQEGFKGFEGIREGFHRL